MISIRTYDFAINKLVLVFCPVGTVQFPFFSHGSAAGNMYVYLCEDALSGHSGAEDWVCSLNHSPPTTAELIVIVCRICFGSLVLE